MEHVVSEKNESYVELTKNFNPSVSVKQEELNECKHEATFNCIKNISKIMKRLNSRHN